MNKPPLRVVEGGNMDKQKALDAALAEIEKSFGKGSIMRLGANDRIIEVRGHLHRLARRSTSRSGTAACRAGASSRSSGRRARARRR